MIILLKTSCIALIFVVLEFSICNLLEVEPPDWMKAFGLVLFTYGYIGFFIGVSMWVWQL